MKTIYKPQCYQRSQYEREKHTLKHYKEFGGPKLSDRNIFEAWQKRESKPIDEVAKEKVKEILTTHKPEPIPEDVQKEISRIYKRVEAELLPKSRSQNTNSIKEE